MASRFRTARTVARILPLAAALLLGHAAVGRADDGNRQSKAVQQSLMVAVLVYDMRLRGSDHQFRYAGQYQTRQEVAELRRQNQSLLLAKSSGSTAPFEDVAYYGRLPTAIRKIVQEERAHSVWADVCEKSARFDAASFQLPIADLVNNREAFFLSATRYNMKGPPEAALTLANTYLDADSAVERTNGERDPVTCEDIWSLRNDTNLVTAYQYKVARKQCRGFRALAACLVELETHIAELLPAATAGGRAIDPSWRAEYLTDDGAFVPVLSR